MDDFHMPDKETWHPEQDKEKWHLAEKERKAGPATIGDVEDMARDLKAGIAHLTWRLDELIRQREERKFWNRARRFLQGMRELYGKKRAALAKRTERFRTRQRRHFYRFRVERFHREGSRFSSSRIVRVTFEMQPTWLGRRLGYPKFQRGFWGLPGSWQRSCSYPNDAKVTPAFAKYLDQVYEERIRPYE
jgi:hypothetical protein